MKVCLDWEDALYSSFEESIRGSVRCFFWYRAEYEGMPWKGSKFTRAALPFFALEADESITE